MCEAVFVEQPTALECITLKMCPKCHTTKLVTDFSKSKNRPDGLNSWCRECDSKKRTEGDKKNKNRSVIVLPEFKICPMCSTEKKASEFVQNKAKKDGLAGVCRKCSNATIKACHEKNKARNVVVYPETKVCPGCNIQKSGMEFSKTKIEKDGLQVYCKKCTSRYHKKRKFGVSEEWFGSTLAAQGGGCAICNTLTSGGRGSFHIDHEHVEGWVKMPPEERRLYVRGLLCSNCNTGSGYFRDDIGVIGKAIDYLNGPTTGILYKEKLPKAIRDRILASQNYLCKICSTNLTTKTACVDHDHLTMIIRGILCNGCNCGLGRFHDSIELLTKVIDYLKERGATFKSQATR